MFVIGLSSPLLRLLLIILLAAASLSSFGQRESYHWYFGANAGLKFSDTGVVALTDGQMNTFEGCASISDSSGNLQFYTDGVRVWDQNHTLVEQGLKGDISSTQSAIIVPSPKELHEYFIFTTSGTTNGMQYSKFDMRLNGGTGGIVAGVRNKSIVSGAIEKITAVKHANQIEYWVIGHKQKGRAFQLFKVSEDGVVESFGNINAGRNLSDGIGYLKVSPNGRKLAMANASNGTIDLFDFNPKTGEISNHITADSITPLQPYGLEFSPDGSILYIATKTAFNDTAYVFQYSLGSSPIRASQELIHEHKGDLGAIQLGGDGKVYVTHTNSEYLAAIEKPNELGAACQYNPIAVYLQGQRCRLGLPTFIQSYFIDADFVFDGHCAGEAVNFHALNSGVDSLLWDFGDPASGPMNSSRLPVVDHIFATAGNYLVKLTTYSKGESESYSEIIEITETPVFSFGPDTFYCDQIGTELQVPYPEGEIIWDNDERFFKRQIDSDGTFWAVADLDGCIYSDTVKLSFFPTPEEFTSQINACLDEEVLLQVSSPKTSVNWNTSSTASFIYTKQGGIYTATVSNPCGIDTAVFDLNFVDCSCIAFVPNAFTPNGDQLNDGFKPVLNCELELAYYRFRLYNRWGQMIFETNDIQERFTPDNMNTDIYLWTLEFGTDSYTTNIAESQSGIVHLIK